MTDARFVSDESRLHSDSVHRAGKNEQEKSCLFILWSIISWLQSQTSLRVEWTLHGSRHRRKHPKGRRKVGRKKRRMMRLRRALRTK